MDKYYCYIFYDENWCAYYVGYASHERRLKTGHTVPIPDEEHRQIFRFKTSWGALECERELVSFWGREIDGGCLKNKAIGGTIGPKGCPLPKSAATRKKMKEARKNRVIDMEALCELAAKKARIKTTVKSIETGEVKSFESRTSCCRELNLDIGTLVKRGRTKGWALV